MAWVKSGVVKFCRLLADLFWKVSIGLNGMLAKVSHGFGMPFEDAFWDSLTQRTRMVTHNSQTHGRVMFRISQVNTITNWRAATLSTKEPETLQWIDDFEPNWHFIDVGANVGIYSLYYLSVRNGEALCVEPSVNNLQQLAINLKLNNFQSRSVIVPNPLVAIETNSVQMDTNSVQPGAAESSAGGLISSAALSYRISALTLDALTQDLPGPFALKIDVDGLETQILQGASRLLASQKCRTVLVENDRENSQRKLKIESLLRQAGMRLDREAYSELMTSNSTSDETVNQIWTRDLAGED
ncbi:FkbM family methyltransferase [bacterium]|nr:FkbM family methyltransferase [bacterium]